MKILFRYMFIFSIASLSAGVVLAQEGMNGGGTEISTDSDRDLFEREKIVSSPGEGDTRTYTKTYSTTPAKESAGSASQSTTTQSPVTTAQPKVKTEKPAGQASPKPTIEKGAGKSQDDSILSFNFLYYIIEKYKLQDIVD